MINLHESYVAELGFVLEIPGSAVRQATYCNVQPGKEMNTVECVTLSDFYTSALELVQANWAFTNNADTEQLADWT